MDTKLLFVCLGNICRSPAAEGIMKKIVEEHGLSDKIHIDSAGTYGGHSGEKADARMRAAAAKRGYNLTSRSRRICDEDFDLFDMIIVMDDTNYERVHRIAPTREASQKIYRMVEFCSYTTFDHVPDPYYEGHEGFEIVLNILEDGCNGLMKKLK